MRSLRILATTLVAIPSFVLAGDNAILSPYEPESSPIVEDPFERAIRPITNPTLFDLALPRTQARPIVIHNKLPSKISTTLGDLDLGGDYQVYALQLEYALSERFSLVAGKDGFVDLNPDDLLSNETGFANLAAGFKWAFLYNPEDRVAMSLSTQLEVPTGNGDVFQGTGDGALIPAVNFLKLTDRLQFSATLGFHLPFDQDEESTTMFASAHVSYTLTDRLFPLIELNYITTLDEGDGGRRFNSQVNGAVPGVAEFEGGDLLNLGAANGGSNDHLSLAAGFRYRLNDHVDLGAAYEIPLMDESDGLMDSRLTFDLVYRF